MRFCCTPDSRVFVDLRATGVLKALAHSPTLVAKPEPFEVVADGDRFESSIEVIVHASAIEPPADLSSRDRDKLRENLLGPQVLDAQRFPVLVFHGIFAGSVAGGTLGGTLEVRGEARSVSIAVRVARRDDVVTATGAWEGRLTELGVTPFKALLGAIRLEDWIRIRLDARFVDAGQGAGRG